MNPRAIFQFIEAIYKNGIFRVITMSKSVGECIAGNGNPTWSTFWHQALVSTFLDLTSTTHVHILFFNYCFVFLSMIVLASSPTALDLHTQTAKTHSHFMLSSLFSYFCIFSYLFMNQVPFPTFSDLPIVHSQKQEHFLTVARNKNVCQVQSSAGTFVVIYLFPIE